MLFSISDNFNYIPCLMVKWNFFVYATNTTCSQKKLIQYFSKKNAKLVVTIKQILPIWAFRYYYITITCFTCKSLRHCYLQYHFILLNKPSLVSALIFEIDVKIQILILPKNNFKLAFHSLSIK